MFGIIVLFMIFGICVFSLLDRLAGSKTTFDNLSRDNEIFYDNENPRESSVYKVEQVYGVDVYVPKTTKISFNDANTIYIDGLKDVLGGSKTTLKIQNDSLLLQKGSHIIRSINKDRLIEVEIMSEHQISKQVTLGRMLCFGIFALGMKKSKDIFSNFLIITYYQNENTEQLILKPSQNLEKTLKILKAFMNK